MTPKAESRPSSAPDRMLARMRELALDLAHEIGAVLGVADRRRRQHMEARHRNGARQRDEAAQILGREPDAVGMQPAGLVDVAAEAAQHLFVEQHARRAVEPVIDDETQRVGADIDDGDRAAAAAVRLTPRRRCHDLAGTSRGVWRGRGVKALPRPESEGLVMK